MAIGTVSNLYDSVRALLGDTDIPGGDVFTDSVIQLMFESAWTELIAMANEDQIPMEKRVWYHNLPASTGVLFPVQLAATDFGYPVFLEERIPSISKTITDAVSSTGTDGDSIKIEIVAHGIAATTECAISDLLGVPNANGRWFASVFDVDNLILRGSQFAGLYVSGGILTISSDRFTEVRQTEQLPDRDQDSKLHYFSWRENAYWFVGATQTIQLRITYDSSGAAPQSGQSLIFDGIMNPLAYRTAALLAYQKGRGQGEAERLDIEARGPNKDGRDGLYFRFLQPLVRQLQQTPTRRPVWPPEHLDYITGSFGP